jgi:GNAT superfamily N-acetyltransferase
MAGFLAGWKVPLFGGSPGVFVPEWGHGALDPDVYRDLYAEAAASWVGNGRTVHALSLFAVDEAGEQVWHDLGFGRAVTDRIRDVRPVGAGSGEVRPAVPGDGAVLAGLRRRTSQYLAEPPVCRRGEYPESEEAIDEALSGRPGYVAFLAVADGEVAGFVDTAPFAGDAPESMSGPQIVRIGGIFTVPERRRHGLGTALVDALLAWGRREGYRSCSLDHETANVAGARFWQAVGFAPVIHSVVRRT